MEVSTTNWTFVPLRIDVSDRDEGTVKAYYISMDDSSVAPQRVQYPLLLRPTGTPEYFTLPQSFDPLSMLKNPMLIMMLVFGGMVFIMPTMNSAVQQQQQELARQKKQATPQDTSEQKTTKSRKQH